MLPNDESNATIHHGHHSDSIFRNVFHPTDLSAWDEVSFSHALRIAWAAHSKLSLLHVSGHGGPPAWDAFPHVRDSLSRWGLITEGASHSDVLRSGLDVSKVQVHSDDPAAAIVHHLKGHPADLVVLATRQSEGIERWIRPSVAASVARDYRAKTLFVPIKSTGFVSADTGEIKLRRILIPVDYHLPRENLIQTLLRLVEILGIPTPEFHVFHAESRNEDPAPRIPRIPGFEPRITRLHVEPVPGILRIAEMESTDLIVMATEGRHGFLDGLRGSTTERVVRHARCPVLMIPAYFSEHSTE